MIGSSLALLWTALAQKKLSAAAAEIRPIVEILRMVNSPSRKPLKQTAL